MVAAGRIARSDAGGLAPTICSPTSARSASRTTLTASSTPSPCWPPVAGFGLSWRARVPHSRLSSTGPAQRSIGDRFHWLGLVTDRAADRSARPSADVCVAPEIDSEFNRLATFVKIIEYMSAGAAVAAHRLPQTESLAGDTIAYADDMTAEGLAAAIADLLASRSAGGAWATPPAAAIRRADQLGARRRPAAGGGLRPTVRGVCLIWGEPSRPRGWLRSSDRQSCRSGSPGRCGVSIRRPPMTSPQS